MGSESVAWIVAIVLGVAAIGLGWRRSLGGATREWMPDFEKVRPEVEPSVGPGRRRRTLTRRERRWQLAMYLFLGLAYAVQAGLSGRGRPLHLLTASIWAVGAVVFWVTSAKRLED